MWRHGVLAVSGEIVDLGRNFPLSILLAYYYITDIRHQCSSPHISSVNDCKPVGH